MQLSFSLLAAVATAFAAALVSAHPAQQLKRVTTTTSDAGIPTHASTVTDALPAAMKTTTPSSCNSGPPGAAFKGRAIACPNAW